MNSDDHNDHDNSYGNSDIYIYNNDHHGNSDIIKGSIRMMIMMISELLWT